MAVTPNFHSDDELIKRLQIVLRDVESAGGDLVRVDADTREVRNLVSELAERIYNEPEKWGIASIPDDLRDDAAADTLVALLASLPDFRGHRSVAEWFSAAVEERFQELWRLREQGQAADKPSKGGRKNGAGREEGPPPPVFDNTLWEDFEREFPKDALVLRLRYLLRRTPEEMAEMLEAPTPRAVSMRLNRARDRFRMFCDKAGSDAHSTDQMLHELGEVRRR